MSATNSTPVILLHDAAIDEYIATILLTTMPEVTLSAIIVVNGDCITTPAMNAAWRIQQYIRRTDIPLGLSSARGYNPFPWAYRGDCIKINDLDMLQGLPACATPYQDGDALLADTLRSAKSPVTVLCTGPLTPLAELLSTGEGVALQSRIGRLVWMGGAIAVGGNLDPATLPPGVANSYAEWNVFWDPFAADWIFRNTSFPITLFPLDITNKAAIASSFMGRLLVQAKQYPVSNLAYQSYEIVASESFYDMWDVTATVWLARPEFYQPLETMTLAVVTEDAGMQGALIPDQRGRQIDCAKDFQDIDAFYSYVLAQLAR
ncbi:nucleoside hydrolase [Sorangium sp. So ce341]|uniref:nucleoside hydrolase n=1 Tax=Sorangium sp. So ce341 TaxID=3133302 RepID=UPI003F5F2BF7